MVSSSLGQLLSVLAVITANAFAQTTQGSKCVGSHVMCIRATVNSTTTHYEIASDSSVTPGWMAIGFGTSMINSPMVIMWSNSDGSITLSQRIAMDHVEPHVQNPPPRVATLDTSGSNAAAAQPTFAFTIPTQSGTSEKLIWAVGPSNPGSAAVDAELQPHSLDGGMGTLTLDVSKAVSSSSQSGSSTSTTSGGSSGGNSGTSTGTAASSSTSTSGSGTGGGSNDGSSFGLSSLETLFGACATLLTIVSSLI